MPKRCTILFVSLLAQRTRLQLILHFPLFFSICVGRAAKDTMKQATCQPIDQVVSVVPKDERDPTVFYFPSCVLLKQCGGCCAHSGTSCLPTETEDKQVTIRKTKFLGGSKFQSMGDITVDLKVHKKCRCQCMKTANDCNLLQRYIPGQCRCECTNLKEAEECTKVSKLPSWR